MLCRTLLRLLSTTSLLKRITWKPFCSRNLATGGIVCLLFWRVVILAVHFHYQSFFQANEVGDEVANGVLPSKLVSARQMSECIPQAFFAWCHFLSIVMCECFQSWIAVGRSCFVSVIFVLAHQVLAVKLLVVCKHWAYPNWFLTDRPHLIFLRLLVGDCHVAILYRSNLQIIV